MTQTEYLNLKATFVQGCLPERRNLIETMQPTRLAEFIDALTFEANTPSQCETWRYLAQIMAIHYIEDMAAVREPVPCNGACEMKRAASSAELAALGAPMLSDNSLPQEV